MGTLLPVALIETAFTAWISTLLPTFLGETLGDRYPTIGIFQSSAALGVVLSSSLVLPSLCHILTDRAIIISGNLAFSAALVFLSLSKATWVLVSSIALLSFGIGTFRGIS